MTTIELESLERDALAIRKRFLRMHFENQAGHIGTGLSAIDLLTYLYKSWLKEKDRFILSKGHGASSLYATLHHYGILTSEDLATYYQDGTLLPAHPAPNAWEAIPAATGSLGHGLSIATGLAYAAKKLVSAPASLSAPLPVPSKVTCLLSDGECNEGAVWEAAMFAAHHALDNLTVIVDANGLQGFGRTSEVMNMEPFRGKWEAFGFDVREINGHDFRDIHQALNSSRASRPVCIVARTIKGKGVRFMEDRMEWHYLPMKKEQYEHALQELETGRAP